MTVARYQGNGGPRPALATVGTGSGAPAPEKVAAHNPERQIRCINQWIGCNHLGLYVTRRGLACPDCLPAVLVHEARTR